MMNLKYEDIKNAKDIKIIYGEIGEASGLQWKFHTTPMLKNISEFPAEILVRVGMDGA